jgi:hypothetical protein
MKLHRPVVIPVALSCLASCAAPSFESVALKKESLPSNPAQTLAVGFSKSFFQERFMGKSIATAIAFGPLLGGALWQEFGSYDERTGARLESGPFEELLGEFDVVSHFFERLEHRIESSTFLEFTFAKDPELAERVLRQVAAHDPADRAAVAEGRHGCVTALKLSYGLGARHGGEQFGFTKSYRPFLLLIGLTKRSDTSEVLWKERVLVFGDTRYRGDAASADRIQREELVASFEALTEQAIDLLIQSLNGEPLPEMPVLVDLTAADLEL